MTRQAPIWFALVLVLASCGGGGGGGGSSNHSPITMGELLILSGQYATYGEGEAHALHAAVEEINKNGGIMGRTLQEVAQNTGGDAVDALLALKKLELSSPAFVYGPTSLEFSGVVKQFDPAKIVDWIDGGTSELDHMTYKYVFRSVPSDTEVTAAMAYFAIQKGWTRAAILIDNSSDSVATQMNLVRFYTAHGGQVLSAPSLSPDQTSYRSEVAAAFATNPQIVFVRSDYQTAATLFSDMRELGDLTPAVPVISDDNGLDPQFAKGMGWPTASQLLYGFAGTPPSTPAYQHFLDVYKAAYPTEPPPFLSQTQYDAVIISALAMTDAKSSDPSVWVKKITDVSNPPGQQCYTYASCVALLKAGTKINYEGAANPQDFNQYHNVSGDWTVAHVTPDGKGQIPVFTVPASAVGKYETGS
jgi:ABC-type branched-subunit amino acid transport system substrate-binding protein